MSCTCTRTQYRICTEDQPTAIINYSLGLEMSKPRCCISGGTFVVFLSDLTRRLYSQATYLRIMKQNAIKSVHREILNTQNIIRMKNKAYYNWPQGIAIEKNFHALCTSQYHRSQMHAKIESLIDECHCRTWKQNILKMGFRQQIRVCERHIRSDGLHEIAS